MDSSPIQLAGIALAWAGYFALHSLLAASGVKAWFGRRRPRWMPAYRVAFNVIAALALLPVLWLVYATESAWLWRWQGVWAWVANGIALLAIGCFIASTRAYDMREFLGLRQLKEHHRDDQQTFTLSVFHRYVRHPWYCFGLALVWTRDMNGPLLVSALAITAYLVIGSKLEERKLVERYGEKYRWYMDRVPGLVPLPWRHLTASEADALLNSPDLR